MAFDFNGSKRPSAPSNDSARKDVDDFPSASDTDSPVRSVGGFGGFSDRPSSSGRPASGFDNSSGNTAPRYPGFQNKPSGFSNRPENKISSNFDTGMRLTRNSPARSTPRAPAKRPATKRGVSGNDFVSIPWRSAFPVIGIILLVILCVVFREAIMEFLTQVLAWIIIILIIVFLVKHFIFGGNRRK